MTRYLGKHYGVENIITPRKIHRLHKKFRFLGFSSSLVAKRYVNKKLKYITSNDIIISHDSHIFDGVNKDVIKNLKCKKVLLLRNPVTREFVERAYTLFDKIYTFEQDKTTTLGVEYLPQFIPVGYKEVKLYESLQLTVRQPRCFFLGRDKGRLQCLTDLAKDLENAGCEIDFSIVKDRTSTGESIFYIDREIDYAYSFLNTIMSDIVIDIVQKGQTGWTLRVLEAIYLNKKVITNNSEILHSEFYSPERVFILGLRDWREISTFLTHTTPPLESGLLYKHSPDNMLNTIKNI